MAVLKLLLDEHLSPRLTELCANEFGVYAASVGHLGLGGTTDLEIWRYAFDHDYTVVTTNGRDFLRLLTVDLHPGLIVLREGGLSRGEQWERLAAAIEYVQRQPDPDNYLINRVIEIWAIDPLYLVDREIPPP